MPQDPFFTQTTCDRCHAPLPTRTMSWFTNETICMACSEAEAKIKRRLRNQGIANAMEGCGFVPEDDPTPEAIQRTTDEANGQEHPEDFTLRSHQ